MCMDTHCSSEPGLLETVRVGSLLAWLDVVDP